MYLIYGVSRPTTIYGQNIVRGHEISHLVKVCYFAHLKLQ